MKETIIENYELKVDIIGIDAVLLINIESERLKGVLEEQLSDYEITFTKLKHVYCMNYFGVFAFKKDNHVIEYDLKRGERCLKRAKLSTKNFPKSEKERIKKVLLSIL